MEVESNLSPAQIHERMPHSDRSHTQVLALRERFSIERFSIKHRDRARLIGMTGVYVIQALYHYSTLFTESQPSPMDILNLKMIFNFHRFPINLIVTDPSNLSEEIKNDEEFAEAMRQTRSRALRWYGRLETSEDILKYFSSLIPFEEEGFEPFRQEVLAWYTRLGYTPSNQYILSCLGEEFTEYEKAAQDFNISPSLERYLDVSFELADIFIYLIVLSHQLKIDLVEEIDSVLRRNVLKRLIQKVFRI